MRDMRFESPINAKEAFYSMASKAKMMDVYAKARFDREPWHLTDLKIRKERRGEHAEPDNESDRI